MLRSKASSLVFHLGRTCEYLVHRQVLTLSALPDSRYRINSDVLTSFWLISQKQAYYTIQTRASMVKKKMKRKMVITWTRNMPKNRHYVHVICRMLPSKAHTSSVRSCLLSCFTWYIGQWYFGILCTWYRILLYEMLLVLCLATCAICLVRSPVFCHLSCLPGIIGYHIYASEWSPWCHLACLRVTAFVGNVRSVALVY